MRRPERTASPWALVAQAMSEAITLLSKDQVPDEYAVDVLW